MTPNLGRARLGTPTFAEVAALTRRLRALPAVGRDADPPERAAFLADKDALLARIAATADATTAARDRSRAGFAVAQAVRDILTDAVLARAAGDGYVLVGPSARTWRRDPDTGMPTVAATDAEHQAVRDLLGRSALDTTEPEWVTCPDGHADVHCTVHIADDAEDWGQEHDTRALDDTDEAATDPRHYAGRADEDRNHHRTYTVDEAVAVLASTLGCPEAADSAVREHITGRYGPEAGAAVVGGGVLEHEDLDEIARHTTDGPWADDAPGDDEWWARASAADGTTVTLDHTGYYSDVAIAALADAQQVAAAEATIDAGTAPPRRVDDPAEIAGRIARLRELTNRSSGRAEAAAGHDQNRAPDVDVDDEECRAQLVGWSAKDERANRDAAEPEWSGRADGAVR